MLYTSYILYYNVYLWVLHFQVTLVALVGLVGGPQGKVVPQQLHDQGRVLV